LTDEKIDSRNRQEIAPLQIPIAFSYFHLKKTLKSAPLININYYIRKTLQTKSAIPVYYK
ncbi:MAG: hypothetical protein IJD28_03495, partial [Deferribacterales bacterium]|nr:hypothetical protein [Deferribacterales bacterium]